jgi:nucleolar complex protein 3
MPVKRKEKLKIPLADASGSDFDTDPEFPSDLDSDLEGLGEGSGSSSGSGSELGEEDSDVEEDINDLYDEVSEDSEEDEPEQRKRKSKKEEEAEYETSGRTRWAPKAADAEPDSVEVGRLPIKLPTGEIQMVKGSTRIALPPSKKPPPPPESETEEEEEEEDIGSDDGAQATEMAGQKGKFGRMGVAEIVGMKGWKNAQKLEAAKEQIAVVGAEILAGGELVDNVGRLPPHG